jgi:hypothetical protein
MAQKDQSNASELVDRYIEETGGWRGDVLAAVRKAILAADPGIAEEWKWMGTPTYSRDGMIAVANAFKAKVNVTFAYGASLPDPDNLFNSGYGGNTRRAIDIFEGDKLNARALTTLVRAAIEYNRTKLKKNAPAAKSKAAAVTSPVKTRAKSPSAGTTAKKKSPAAASAKKSPTSVSTKKKSPSSASVAKGKKN